MSIQKYKFYKEGKLTPGEYVAYEDHMEAIETLEYTIRAMAEEYAQLKQERDYLHLLVEENLDGGY